MKENHIFSRNGRSFAGGLCRLLHFRCCVGEAWVQVLKRTSILSELNNHSLCFSVNFLINQKILAVDFDDDENWNARCGASQVLKRCKV